LVCYFGFVVGGFVQGRLELFGGLFRYWVSARFIGLLLGWLGGHGGDW